MGTVKIATWNVNSIRARRDRLLAFLERHDPDIVCLQETKVTNEAFPHEEIREAGYESVAVGQKTYNGVAILSKRPAAEVRRAFDDGGDDSQARVVAATVDEVRIVCVYVPNGRTVGSEAYEYKLEWMRRLRRFLERDADPSDPLVLTGDFNVAPEDRDVYDPEAWREQVLCSKLEREALRNLGEWGLTDAFRHRNPETVAYSWWDYRQLGFPKNRGLRIDHLFMTRPLIARCTDVTIDRNERKGKSPSDHAPVLATLS